MFIFLNQSKEGRDLSLQDGLPEPSVHGWRLGHEKDEINLMKGIGVVEGLGKKELIVIEEASFFHRMEPP
jgi:hypothetical protein